MPVDLKLKQRLAQQFKKQQTEAQVSRAEHSSDDKPHTSGSKDHVVGQTTQQPTAGAPSQPQLASIATKLTQQKSLEVQRSLPSSKPTSPRKPLERVDSKTLSLLGKRERDAAPIKEEKPKRKQQQPPAKKPATEPAPKFSKPKDQSTIPLEIVYGLNAKPKPVGKIPASTCASYSELWTAIKKVCPDQSVNRTTARICYLDHEEDWISLSPDSSLSIFNQSVERVLVICTKKQEASVK